MQPLFSRTIRASQIGQTPRAERITADAASRAALAAAYGLPEIAELTGDFLLSHEAGGVIAAELGLRARLTQTCVITLEPFEAELTERARLRFVPAATIGEAADLGDLDAAALEAPDDLPYAGDIIDLGAALAEQLALALDPYPRRPGASLPTAEDDRSSVFSRQLSEKLFPPDD